MRRRASAPRGARRPRRRVNPARGDRLRRRVARERHRAHGPSRETPPQPLRAPRAHPPCGRGLRANSRARAGPPPSRSRPLHAGADRRPPAKPGPPQERCRKGGGSDRAERAPPRAAAPHRLRARAQARDGRHARRRGAHERRNTTLRPRAGAAGRPPVVPLRARGPRSSPPRLEPRSRLWPDAVEAGEDGVAHGIGKRHTLLLAERQPVVRSGEPTGRRQGSRDLFDEERHTLGSVPDRRREGWREQRLEDRRRELRCLSRIQRIHRKLVEPARSAQRRPGAAERVTARKLVAPVRADHEKRCLGRRRGQRRERVERTIPT